MKKTLLALALLQTLTAYAKDPLPEKITGLKTPESVVQAKDGAIYISEIGTPDVKGDGQISKVDKKGSVTVFAKGLDDPKGLAIIGNKLYAADKAGIIEIKQDGTWQVYAAAATFPKPPVFLNDLEADKLGNLYVSDSNNLKSGGSIYKIAKGGAPVTVVADSKNPDILAPNGLLFEGRNNLLSIDFESGILYRVNLTTGATIKLAEGFGGGDGLVKTKAGKIIISSWKTGTINEVVAGKARVIKEGYKSAADIALSTDGTFLMVPDMLAGELDFIEIK
ncbi:MAG: SMP-30/gluconolactonase/LRE family protein [Pseudomonadota bacterium]